MPSVQHNSTARDVVTMMMKMYRKAKKTNRDAKCDAKYLAEGDENDDADSRGVDNGDLPSFSRPSSGTTENLLALVGTARNVAPRRQAQKTPNPHFSWFEFPFLHPTSSSAQS
jgi:hypothetical protein